jgi:multicomponent Na+:H+ antiporter subunit G
MSISTGPTAAGIKAVLCAVFILLASPTAAHVLATAARKSGIKLPDGDEADGYEKT